MKLIVFDLDNTIYDETAYYLGVAREYEQQQTVLLFPDLDQILNRTFIKSHSDVWGALLEHYQCYTKVRQQALFDLYQTASVPINVYDTFLDMLQFFKEKNMKVGVITNGVVQAQKNKVRCLNLTPLVDVIIYARQWGKTYEKPHEKSFCEMGNVFDIQNDEWLYIGDTFETDILGAQGANIQSIWITSESAENKNGVVVVSSLDKCFEHLKGLF